MKLKLLHCLLALATFGMGTMLQGCATSPLGMKPQDDLKGLDQHPDPVPISFVKGDPKSPAYQAFLRQNNLPKGAVVYFGLRNVEESQQKHKPCILNADNLESVLNCVNANALQVESMLSSEEAYYCTLAPNSNLSGGLNPRIAAKTVYELATLMSNFLNFLDALGPLTESGQIRQEIRELKYRVRILKEELQAYQDQHGRPSYDIMERIQVVESRISELTERLKEISQENRREIERLERLYFLPTVPHPASPCTIF